MAARTARESLPRKPAAKPIHLSVDEPLDAGANVSLEHVDGAWVVADDGIGLDPADVPRLFAVNLPLLSSKLKRLPLRGMLGNGLRVVTGAAAALDTPLIVESRGHRLALSVCLQTGHTVVASDTPIEHRPGLTVRLVLGGGNPNDAALARASMAAAGCGTTYQGPSSPWWYGVKDLQTLLAQVTPADTTVGAVCRDLGTDYDDDRSARSLTRHDIELLLASLRSSAQPLPPDRLGAIGKEFRQPWPGYAQKAAVTTTQSGAAIPYIVEAWATCARSTHKGQGRVNIDLLLNRSMTLATIHSVSMHGYLHLAGCGLDRLVEGPGAGDYQIVLSVITPLIQLASDGKEPSLAPFSEAIAEALRKACGSAHRAIFRPVRSISIKDAARAVMADAYGIASGGGRYPANARQIMYAARPAILRLTGQSKLHDAYFTQNLLPDYLADYPHETEAWDVVFDARGSLTEPHTGYDVPLGTIDVRTYLGERAQLGPVVALTMSQRYPTSGPQHRYSTVLFIEKEGFAPLLQAARIAERFDVAIMSTKGMSTTAARLLLDRLAPRIDKILVLHDFDVSGFSIFGTLRCDGRRFKFENDLPVVDVGLRLGDVEAMALQSEPVETSGCWTSRGRTLQAHGATDAEVAFLATRRVELNAMAADMFIDFLERKLVEHRVQKVVPDQSILEAHARRLIEQGLVEDVVLRCRTEITTKAATAVLPDKLNDKVGEILGLNPELSWDQAVAFAVRGVKAK
jgi:hypothetical protein